MAPADRKGGVALVLGVLLLVGGIVFGIVLAVTGVAGVSRAVDDMQRVPAPGTGTVEIADPGTYHLYYEQPQGLVSDTSSNLYAGDLAITAPNGALLAISSSSSTTTYDFDGHHGRSIGQFRADQAGTYRIRTRSVDAREGDEFSFGPTGYIAVADDSPLSSLWRVLLGVFGGGAM
ncbi:MAG: hypothetical protein KF703_08620, partial [Actinobacteria bacterium]|nr:hypothetical protein [Actinomycetota bacterium]